MKRTPLILMLISLVLCFLPNSGGASCRIVGLGAYVPQPRIICPRSEKLDLTGRKSVVFIWSPHEGRMPSGTRYFDFRIYKGEAMLESTLVFKERVPGNRHELELPSSMFEDGGTYIWSLRQGYKLMGKSRRNIQVFRVVKQGS